MIEQITLKYLSSKALLHYSQIFNENFKKAEVDDPTSQSIFRRLERATNQLHEMIVKAKSEVLTKEIAQADKNQDFSFLILRTSLELEKLKRHNAYHPDADVVLAAIRQVGYSLHSYSYKRQAEALTSLLEAFEKDQGLITAISNLKMEQLVSDLRTHFSEFMVLRNARREDKISKSDYNNLAELRKEIDLLAFHIVQRINSELVANAKNEKYGPLASKINELNNGYRQLDKSKATRRANEQEAATAEVASEMEDSATVQSSEDNKA